jgi:hypothetical protein
MGQQLKARVKRKRRKRWENRKKNQVKVAKVNAAKKK